MTTITTEALKDLSVKVVEDFVNHKVPLSDGIAKCASELELNPEQTKRLIESSNTIAYLKLQKEAEDKTIEFPVADYNQVMKAMCIPDTPDGTLTAVEFNKQAGELLYSAADFNPDIQTVRTWMTHELLANKAILEKLAIEKAGVLMNIGDISKKLSKDEFGIEKLAEVCTEDEFKRLSHLIKTGEITLQDRVFQTSELDDARKLVKLFKQAQTLVEESQARQELEKKAVAMAAAGMLGKGIGGLFGGAASAAVTAAKAGASRIGKSKVLHPLDVAGAALTEPSPSKNVWDNLQGSQKRF